MTGLDDFSSIAVTARTHPPGYAFHKYWARKPHNVVRRALEACGVGPGAVVIDPFCGSGVPLSEAAALGARCVGADVNPVAVELTRITLAPPDPAEVRRGLDGLLEGLERDFGGLYVVDGRRMRFAVHATIAECPGCGERVSADAALRRGRTYACPGCETRVLFNLERLVGTRQLRVVLDDGQDLPLVADHPVAEAPGPCPHDHLFLPNPRILAFDGMSTRHLFTPRAFRVLAACAERIESLPEPVRPAARLTLTASVAQCSRLIAWRNGLTTGGPAWTVPGFWVPPLHLETNPLTHLRARARRTCAGLEHLRGLPGRGRAHVVLHGDAGVALRAEVARGTAATVVFLDPPYGDSVPYLEFSALWNSFLGGPPDPGGDIAVSNRARGDATWERYEEGLRRVAAELRPLLGPSSRVLVTFNNKDARAWQALLSALQAAGLRCRGAFYQHPAVVSTKARLAGEGSYVGDLYSVFEASDSPLGGDPAGVSEAVARAIRSHGGAPPDEGALRRVAVLTILRTNLEASALAALPGLLTAARANAAADSRTTEPFERALWEVAEGLLSGDGGAALSAIEAELHRRFAHLGVASAPRLREALGRRYEITDGHVRRIASGASHGNRHGDDEGETGG